MAKRDVPSVVGEKLEFPPKSANTHVCLDGVYVELPNTERSRRLDVGGKNYEHVSEDADGVWCYRQM